MLKRILSLLLFVFLASTAVSAAEVLNLEVVSNNSINSSFAAPGDTVHISFGTSIEDKVDSIYFGKQRVLIQKACNSFKCNYDTELTLSADNLDESLVHISFKNSEKDLIIDSEIKLVQADSEIPGISNLKITTSNSFNRSFAETGDLVTVTFTKNNPDESINRIVLLSSSVQLEQVSEKEYKFSKVFTQDYKYEYVTFNIYTSAGVYRSKDLSSKVYIVREEDRLKKLARSVTLKDLDLESTPPKASFVMHQEKLVNSVLSLNSIKKGEEELDFLNWCVKTHCSFRAKDISLAEDTELNLDYQFLGKHYVENFKLAELEDFPEIPTIEKEPIEITQLSLSELGSIASVGKLPIPYRIKNYSEIDPGDLNDFLTEKKLKLINPVKGIVILEYDFDQDSELEPVISSQVEPVTDKAPRPISFTYNNYHSGFAHIYSRGQNYNQRNLELWLVDKDGKFYKQNSEFIFTASTYMSAYVWKYIPNYSYILIKTDSGNSLMEVK